ncbi:chalcone isomerase family protein [Pseudomonas sp. NPDC089422]|uniref:chalcone isomerase family protein n=1 Tax=Pseudomonas sp. NPDC089422 TaxID=3364466 RepID=UPI0037F2A6FA
MSSLTIRLFALAALLTMALPASADWRASLPAAQVAGSGDFTWFGLRLYTARLWRASASWSWDEPFALELIYHRSLSRNTLVQASIDEIQRLAKRPLSTDTVERWSAAMAEAFVDVRPGMNITGLYLPGQGCRFYVDGHLSLEVTDPAFARAFFAIWLDPRARDAQLRDHLLGLAGSDRGG